ncbi:alpha/beta hydrolase [Staphylococcus carnosus]|uniref:Alpha/beta hydrolase n=1 Tax=Staphylococcus carnosus TaxID=1281 RepID=A0AAJ0JS75_STACA|nr:alpha/beta hydrolase [Staphylococcus carnosus]KKB26461.1 alpha/beta hydrolase [Staphylococcus carnosus]POA01552.1 alpha/beta hydrolase [Staphylococcus carnosus]QQS85415.1 alpha/beta hydrolase [Staphylococcus carnosus]QRQ05349.1 alpha/beta hydrolase [Staphylococcus carnosus]UTB82645.1 alpha/beta hydrolase [Staphylococcus carnosus]
MAYEFKRSDVTFDSDGTPCSAWFYLPDISEKPPIIVMAPGLGGVKDMRLDDYAAKFAEAGFASLVFDYRNFGNSGGNRRQYINVKDQLEDWNYAIKFAKSIDSIDETQLLLFGTSFSGGHVMTLSSMRNDITATITQCPYTDTFATLKAISSKSESKLTLLALFEKLLSISSYHSIMVPLAGEPGSISLMAVPDYQQYLELVPERSTFENKAQAATIFEFLKYSPGRYAQEINNPIFYAVCSNDNLAPAKTTIRHAKRSQKPTIREFNCGYFEIYSDNYFEEATDEYVKFFKENTI